MRPAAWPKVDRVGTRLTTNKSTFPTDIFFTFEKYIRRNSEVGKTQQVTFLDSTCFGVHTTAVVLVCRLVVNFWASGAKDPSHFLILTLFFGFAGEYYDGVSSVPKKHGACIQKLV